MKLADNHVHVHFVVYWNTKDEKWVIESMTNYSDATIWDEDQQEWTEDGVSNPDALVLDAYSDLQRRLD